MKELSQKIFVLGIDGMDPRFTMHLLKQGKMPNVQKLIDRGAYHHDLSMLGAHPTITPPMWTTLATGAFPNTHGITCFSRQGSTISRIAYNFDSTLCKAEQLWNVTAESGKKTLVWHWPGSSWPPSSDRENLYVVDGTQPASVNSIVNIDKEFLFIANVKTEEVVFKPRAASDSNIPCVVNDVSPTDLELSGSDYLHEKENLILKPEDGESVVSILPADVVMSPIKGAHGWIDAPADAKEFTMLFSQGLIRRMGLILKNEQGIYDRVAIYKNKKSTEPIVILEPNVFTTYIYDDAIVDDVTYAVFRNMRILELAENGEHLKMWVSSAVQLDYDGLFHPKSLYQTVVKNAGYPMPFSFMGGSDKVLINDCTGANWEASANWTADALLYLMHHENFEVVFSHFHNVDLQGHMIVKYLKGGKNLPGQKLSEPEYNELFEEVYLQTDRYVGRYLPLLDEGWTILMVSDHGQVCPEHHHHELGDPNGVNVRVLQRLGYTAIKINEAGEEIYEIDWEHTKAVAIRANHIYLNIKGRDPYGIIDPKDQYQVEEELMTAMYGYRDPETGMRVFALALRNRDTIQLGMGGEECGDIIYMTAEGYNMDHGDCLSSCYGYDDTSVAPIFIAAGPGIKPGVTERVIREVDVAPTIAVLAGVRMPHQCEGAPVYQILSEYFSFFGGIISTPKCRRKLYYLKKRDTMTTTTKKKSFEKTIIHSIVIAVIILGFGHLPTFSTVTPYGMKALGCFIAIIYGWLFAGMLITSILAFILIPFTGLVTANGLLIAGFGNIVTLQVLFVLMLFSIMNNTEIPLKITNSLLGLKICQGKPWIFVGILMFATWLVSFIAGGVIPLFIVFPIIMSLCEEYHIERYSKTSTMLFMGVLLADCIGQMCLPIKGMPLILMSLYNAVDPTAVFPLGIYMIYTTLLTFFILIIGLLSMKYIIRTDLSVLANIDTTKYRGEQNKFTTRERWILGILLIVLILMVLQSIFPIQAIKNFMGQFGMIGFVLVGIIAVLLIKIDGTPISNMKELSSGVQWDIVLCVASMNPAMGFLSSDEAGIKDMLSAVCGPFISSLSPLAFVLIIIIICGVLTNFLNNQACCLMFYPIIMVYAPTLGINAVALVTAMIVISHVAFATPAASFYSLITFGYTDWIKTSVFMKWAFILLIPLLLCSATFSYILFFLF